MNNYDLELISKTIIDYLSYNNCCCYVFKLKYKMTFDSKKINHVEYNTYSIPNNIEKAQENVIKLFYKNYFDYILI